MDPAPDTVIAGRYRLVSPLGRGGMGSVWRAEHLALKSPVAIKLLEPSIAATEVGVARFVREAQAAAALRSAHVVQIFDYGVDGGVPFIAMELLSGESLEGRLARVRVLSPQETARIMSEVARAVSKAHDAGIVHRDLKPDNIFLVREDDHEVAKVLDFGIAKVSQVTDGQSLGPATRTGAIMGTPYYMSPEQAQGDKTVDARTDTWAMAVIAFRMLTGQLPFDAEALGSLILKICSGRAPVPSQVAPVPPQFDAWFARAVEQDPNQRFQHAREAAEALRVALLGEAVGGLTPVPYGSNPQLGTAVSAATDHRYLTTGAASSAEVAIAATGRGTQTSSKKAVWVVVGLASLAVVAGGIFVASRLVSRDEPQAESPASGTASLPPAPPPVEPAAPPPPEMLQPSLPATTVAAPSPPPKSARPTATKPPADAGATKPPATAVKPATTASAARTTVATPLASAQKTATVTAAPPPTTKNTSATAINPRLRATTIQQAPRP